MAFCLLARDRLSGAFSLLSAVSFADADDAVTVLTGLVTAGEVDADAVEPLVVDVSGAARLIVMSLPTQLAEEMPDAAPEPVPAAGAWEAPPEAQPELLGTAIGEPIVEATPVAASVAEQRLEPEPSPALVIESPVESVPEPSPDLPPEDAVPAPAVPPLVPAGFTVDSITRLEPAPMPVERTAEPIVAGVQALEESEVAAEEAPAAARNAEESQAEAPASAPRAEEAPSELPETEPQADERLPVEPSLEALPVIIMDAGPYEVSGELVLERYTCSDCVYANTCPKVGQSTPADCGSFQWNVS